MQAEIKETDQVLPEGFELRTEGDHFLELYYRGEFIALFNQTKATIQTINEYIGKIRCPFNSKTYCTVNKKYTCVEIECPVYFGEV
jgi:hypothetical protein